MRLLELSDVILMDGIKNSVDSLSVMLPSRRIGKLRLKSELVLKEALLLDLSHNCFDQIEDMFFKQFPQAWWFLFRGNNVGQVKLLCTALSLPLLCSHVSYSSFSLYSVICSTLFFFRLYSLIRSISLLHVCDHCS